jgi:Helix-turn-helix domain
VRKHPPRKKKGKPTGPRSIDGEILDVTAVAKLLGIKPKMARARASRRLLPFRRWAGRLIFIRSEVLAFLEQLSGCRAEEALENLEAREK